jgi:P-type Cu+ transporter
MTCKNCVANIENNLREKLKENVKSINISLEEKSASIETNNIKEVINIINNIGKFKSELQVLNKDDEFKNYKINITGMSCKNCVANIEKNLREKLKENVKSIHISLEEKSASIETNNIKEVINVINNIGKFKSELNKNEEIIQIPEESEKISITIKQLEKVKIIIENKIKNEEEILNLFKENKNVEKVKIKNNTIKITFDSNKMTKEDLINTLKELGYNSHIKTKNTEKPIKVKLKIEGMTCSSCSSKIESKLKSEEGIHSCEVNLLLNTAIVEYNPNKVGVREIIKMIDNLGFHALLLENSDVQVDYNDNSEILNWRKKFIYSLFLMIPIVILSMVDMFFVKDHSQMSGFRIIDLISILLVTPLHFVIGFNFHYSCFKSLINCYADMNVLISIATNTAYFYTVVSMILSWINPKFMITNFFETCAMLISCKLFHNKSHVSRKIFGVRGQGKNIKRIKRFSFFTSKICGIDNEG